ncbi:MAG: hypothetical protein M3295_07500 [Chloroflexota bacterium]|nr:hypothetical protein [Chloroflexota bacterium]
MPDDRTEKAKRRAARELVGDYHERELTRLLERMREGFAQLDAGEVDAFDLDELVHRYKRSARELWKFCNVSRSETVAWLINDAREQGEEVDWWAAGEPRRQRDC